MSDVSSTFSALSSTEGNNRPTGADVIGGGLDDNLRMMQAHVAAWRDLTGWGGILLSSVTGTNSIAATVAAAGSITFGPTALAAGQRFILTPAATNTGATNLNITSPNGGSALGAKNIFKDGAACAGGELIINSPVELLYDGTQFNIMGPGGGGITFSTEQATTSGTSIDFTGIPAGVRRITLMLVGVSLDANTNLIFQLGKAAGVETSGYLGAATQISAGGTPTSNPTGSFRTETASSAAVFHGTVVFTLEDSSDNTWTCYGQLGRSDTGAMDFFAGSKPLAGTLDRVRMSSGSGTANFDAGVANLTYELK